METPGSGHGRNMVQNFLQGTHFGHPCRPQGPIDPSVSYGASLRNALVGPWLRATYPLRTLRNMATRALPIYLLEITERQWHRNLRATIPVAGM